MRTKKAHMDINAARAALMLRHRVYIDYVPHKKLQLSLRTLQDGYFASCTPDAVLGDHGFYESRFLRPWHWIRLSKNLQDPHSALALMMTLAHELIHAQQAERFGDPKSWREYYLSLRKQFTYWSDPIEVEARERAPQIAPLIIWRS